MAKRYRTITPRDRESLGSGPPLKKSKNEPTASSTSTEINSESNNGGKDLETSDAPLTHNDHASTPAQDNTQPTIPHTGHLIWKILDNDERTQLVVGLAEPHRLTIRVRHRTTNHVRTFTYPKLETAIETIDWTDIAHIRRMMKWRNKVFRSLDFPMEHTITRWTDAHVMFLTLVCEKCVRAVELDRAISLPSVEKVVGLFVGAFGEGVHSSVAIRSRLRRRDGSRLSWLKERLAGELKPRGGPEFRVTVVEGELEAYMEEGYVELEFEAGRYRRWVEGEKEEAELDVEAVQVVNVRLDRSLDGLASSKELSTSGSQTGLSDTRDQRADAVGPVYSQTAARTTWLSVVMGATE